jgi:hypothetical protein
VESSEQSSATQRTEKTSSETNYGEKLSDAGTYIDVGPQAVPADIWRMLDAIFAPVDE